MPWADASSSISHMNRGLADDTLERRATVQPGVINDELMAAAAEGQALVPAEVRVVTVAHQRWKRRHERG